MSIDPRVNNGAEALIKQRLGVMWPSANQLAWEQAFKDARCVVDAIDAIPKPKKKKRKAKRHAR